MASQRTFLVDADSAARRAAVTSVIWLLGALVAGLLLQLKLIFPGTLDVDLLSYGRVRAVHDTLFMFGFLTPAFYVAVLAVIPRVSGIQLHNERQGRYALAIWNVALFAAVHVLLLGSLRLRLPGLDHRLGGMQARAFGELPAALDAVLVLVMAMLAYQAGATLVRRRERRMYVASWYLFAAAVGLPVVFVAGNLPVFSGVADAIAGGFSTQGLLWLWLAPAAIGALYHVFPTVTGNPLHSGRLARIGFWSLVLAGGWTGQRAGIWGPAPDYLESIAIAMSAVLVLPVLTATSNLFSTARGGWRAIADDFGLRFGATGTGLLVVFAVLQAGSSSRPVARWLGLTAWETGLRWFSLYGCFTVLAFGALYHLYPRISGRAWYSRRLCSFHFWTTLSGSAILATASFGYGLMQAGAGPLAGLGGVRRGADLAGLAGLVVFAAGQCAFAVNIYRTAERGDPLALVVPRATAGVA